MTDAPLTVRDLAQIPLTRLKGVGDKKISALETIGLTSVLDLLTYYPRRYVDRSREARVSDLRPGEEATVLVTVRSVNKRMTRNRKAMVTAVVGDSSGRLDVVFFNQPWRERQLKPELAIALYGKVDS